MGLFFDNWWNRRSQWPAVPVDDLIALKAAQRICVVVLADEARAETVNMVAALFQELAGLVDDVVLVDSGSADVTTTSAVPVGTRVVTPPADIQAYGRGGALWWGQQRSPLDSSELIVWLDSSAVSPLSRTAVRLLTPLLLEPSVHFAKAAFEHVLTANGELPHGSAGRVTELLARPLLNAWWPELALFVQPLSSEFSVRRTLLSSLPLDTGYGLELGMLIDILGSVGLDAMAQVDIGQRHHSHHSDAVLGHMAAQVLATAQHRRGQLGADRLVQFARSARHGLGFDLMTTDVAVASLAPTGSAPTSWSTDE